VPHPLHEVISRLAAEVMPSDCTLVKDPACVGNQRIPLFCADQRSLATKYCDVDLLVLRNNRIRLIVEIEESNRKPTQIAGKFLTSALASYLIHDNHGNTAIAKDAKLVFLQVVDTTGLKVRSVKRNQWSNLERSIQSILPLGGIREYRLFCGDAAGFLGSSRQMIDDAITQACQ
jgi:hypothetical protein